MLRPVTPADTETLVQLTTDTGFFKPLEVATLREVLADYHKEDRELGHRAFAWEDDGRVIGFVYHAPTPMTERCWHLYWIVVSKELQGRGLGSRLLEFVESDIRDRGGRMLVVETSTLPHYEPTRRFYLKHQYDLSALIADYYAEGDGMVVFTKKLHT